MTDQPLSEERYYRPDFKLYCYHEQDVKQSIQKTLKELKENFCADNHISHQINKQLIDTIFKQNFGDKILEAEK